MARKKKGQKPTRHTIGPYERMRMQHHKDMLAKKERMKENARRRVETEGFQSAPFDEKFWKIGPYCEGPTELTIAVKEMTRDMSVGSTERYYAKVKCNDMEKGGVGVSIRRQYIRVHEPNEDSIDVTWMGNNYRIKLESFVETETYNVPNPHITWEEVGLTFDYHHYTLYDRAMRAAEVVGSWFRGEGYQELSEADIEEIKNEAREDLATLKQAEKMYELELLLGLLWSCVNWDTLVLTNAPQFRRYMERAIDWNTYRKDEFWHAIILAMKSNPLSEIISDVDKFLPLVKEYAAKGKKSAVRILEEMKRQNLINE